MNTIFAVRSCEGSTRVIRHTYGGPPGDADAAHFAIGEAGSAGRPSPEAESPMDKNPHASGSGSEEPNRTMSQFRPLDICLHSSVGSNRMAKNVEEISTIYVKSFNLLKRPRQNSFFFSYIFVAMPRFIVVQRGTGRDYCTELFEVLLNVAQAG